MMASSNLDHLLYQDHHEVPWPSPSIHTNHEPWSQPLILNCGEQFISDELEVIRPSHNNQLSSVLMVQELGFQRSDNSSSVDDGCSLVIRQEGAHHNPTKIKDELLLPALPQALPKLHAANYPDATTLEGMVLPSVNISRPGPPLPISEMELQALKVMASARLCRSLLCQASPFHSGIPFLGEASPFPYNGSPLVQEAVQMPSVSSNSKTAPLVVRSTGGAEAARGGASNNTIKRPPRFSSSFSSFKVRKEKLGDRVAALQQLVAPFGKTDTASVLMEAIGYIKFLQDQVETLSVPYMRLNKKARTTAQGGSNEERRDDDGQNNRKIDLRSRGLCLVPLSCTSYICHQ